MAIMKTVVTNGCIFKEIMDIGGLEISSRVYVVPKKTQHRIELSHLNYNTFLWEKKPMIFEYNKEVSFTRTNSLSNKYSSTSTVTYN